MSWRGVECLRDVGHVRLWLKQSRRRYETFAGCCVPFKSPGSDERYDGQECVKSYRLTNGVLCKSQST